MSLLSIGTASIDVVILLLARFCLDCFIVRIQFALWAIYATCRACLPLDKGSERDQLRIIRDLQHQAARTFP